MYMHVSEKLNLLSWALTTKFSGYKTEQYQYLKRLASPRPCFLPSQHFAILPPLASLPFYSHSARPLFSAALDRHTSPYCIAIPLVSTHLLSYPLPFCPCSSLSYHHLFYPHSPFTCSPSLVFSSCSLFLPCAYYKQVLTNT